MQWVYLDEDSDGNPEWLPIGSGSGVQIDDNATDLSTTWSSQKQVDTFAIKNDTYTKTEVDSTFTTQEKFKTHDTAISNLQTQIDDLGGAMRYVGKVQTRGELLLIDESTLDSGDVYVILADESYNSDTTMNVWNSGVWDYIGSVGFSERDFFTNGIVLSQTNSQTGLIEKEVQGLLLGENIDFSSFNSHNISYSADKTVGQVLDDLLYTPITVSMTSTASAQNEMGSTISNPTYSWSISGGNEIQSLIFNGQSIDTALRTITTDLIISSTTTITLVVSDGKSSKSASVTHQFLNGVYYGAATLPDDGYGSDFVSTLTKKLASSKSGSYVVNAGTDQYVYFCLPSTMGASADNFSVGGFTGGFQFVETISYENQFGYACNYDIWRSDNPSLGQVTFVVA